MMNRFFTLLFAASCLTAVGQSEYCLEGTVWDDELGGCVSVILNSADINNDGCVQLGDLLDLLTAYGDCGDEESSWQCGDPLEYQGYDYATVLIGDQCWFAENLRSENYENGDSIPSGLSGSDWYNANSGVVTIYGDFENCSVDDSPLIDACDPAQSLNEYGRLYNGFAVDDPRGLCPSGWHVPSDEEWMTMELALGMSEVEANATEWRGTDQGTQMKTDYGWHQSGNGTNSSGFSGLPGGLIFITLGVAGAGTYGSWWSSTPNDSYLFFRLLDNNSGGVWRNYTDHYNGFSVRCVRDAE